jgi:hypothetical protein
MAIIAVATVYAFSDIPACRDAGNTTGRIPPESVSRDCDYYPESETSAAIADIDIIPILP